MPTGLNTIEIIAINVLEQALRNRALAQSNAKVANAVITKGKNDKKTWTITNIEDPLTLPVSGLWCADNYDESISSNFAEFNTLGRRKPITQFLNGNANSVTFKAVLFAKDFTQTNTTLKLAITNLRKWAQYDKKLKRPPIISFKVADGIGSINYDKALIVSCNPGYKLYDNNGNLVHCEVDLTIREYTTYKPTTQIFDTRYHRVMDGEYHELLAAREYNNPMLGVVVRHYNNQSSLITNDIVKLPDKDSPNISNNLIKPKSLIFSGYTDNSYDKFLIKKQEDSALHIKEIINNKLDIRTQQYNTLYF